jgi:hypothetical protein
MTGTSGTVKTGLNGQERRDQPAVTQEHSSILRAHVEIGWTANELAYDDRGEDVVVKIFDRSVNDSAQSIPCGLSFFAQIAHGGSRRPSRCFNVAAHTG